MAQRVVFRTDASTEIGLGHLMRCLTLADELHTRNARISFICRARAGFLPRLITDRGYDLTILPTDSGKEEGPGDLAHGNWLGTSLANEIAQVSALLDTAADWLVVDHYALDKRWEQAMRPLVGKIMVIDDLADRPHHCDILLDQTLGRCAEEYDQLVSHHTHLMLGTEYALLRPGFARGRAGSLAWRRQRKLPQRLVISMGGIDRLNLSAQIIKALASYVDETRLHVTVILGPTAPWRVNVADYATRAPFPVELMIDPPDIPGILAHSDLGIGGAGGGAWERCAMGLPSIIVVMADNQINGAKQLDAAGASVTIASPDDIVELVPGLLDQIGRDGRLQAMSAAAAAIVDGLGALRVADKMGVGIGDLG